MGFFMGMSKMNLHHRFILSAILLGTLVGIESAQSGESIPTTPAAGQDLVEASEGEFDIAYPYQAVHVGLKLKNTSETPLTIVAIKPRLETDKSTTSMPVRLLPGRSVEIDVVVSTGSAVGRIAKYFDVYSKEREAPIGSFAIRGFVDWVVSPDSTSVNFGRIDLTTGASRTVTVKLRPGADLKLEKVLDEGKHFQAKVLEDGRSVQLNSKKNAPLGLFDEHILVSTSNAEQSKVGIRVRGQFVTRLVPSANPVDFGLLRIGDTAEQIVRLENVDGNPVAIGKIRTEGTPASVNLQDCIPRSESCRNLRIQIPEQQVRGQIGGTVHLELLPSKLDFPIEFGMVVIGKDTQIRSFEEDLKAAESTEPAVSDLLKSAIRTPALPLEVARPPGTGPLLTWQAANEYGVFGYEVYRSVSKNGPFERVTSTFVRRLDSSGQVGSIYRWRDTSAVPGTTYYYYVGLVYEDGRKSEFTTPQMIVAK